MNFRSLCVFCGSRDGAQPVYRQTAEALGEWLGRTGRTLVYGGGHVGLMGAVADATLKAGGRVVGVIPEDMVDRELAHQGVTELHVVGGMHERKALMAERAEAFLALPGGYGTLDELCEIITWAQLGYHKKPVFLLNDSGFYDGFLKFLKVSAEQGFIPLGHLDLLRVVSSVEELSRRA